MKKIIYVFIVAISIFNLTYAGCGSCNVSGKKADSPDGNFITSIGEKGTGIDDHGDSHAKDGFCNAIRMAKVSGTIKKGVFTADLFSLQKD